MVYDSFITKHIHLCVVIALGYAISPHLHHPSVIVSDGEDRQVYTSFMYDARLMQVLHTYGQYLQCAPPEMISHRYAPEQYSYARDIHQELEEIRTWIQQGAYQRIDTIAIRLKDDDFDYTQGTGMLVLRLRNHPFVIKLCIASPRTALAAQGWELFFLTCMNGGINRHISGITRIAANHALASYLRNHAERYSNFTVPRCWSWVPSDTRWLTITMHDDGKQAGASIPSTYALIHDAITYTHTCHDTERIFNLFQDTGNLFDPHAGNCVVDAYTHEYVILDTEHFLSMIGQEYPMKSRSYIEWYASLCLICLRHITFPQLTRTHLA